MGHKYFSLAVAGSVIWLGVAGPGAALAQQDVRVFEQAPAPEVLAQILFPPRYRSIEPATSENPAQAELFGMMINFAFDSADILPESQPLLDSIGEMMGLDAAAGKSIVVEGHTDALGSDAYNQALSEKRARSIKSYLVERFGVAPKRLVPVGKGERNLHRRDEPRAAVNRRAVFRPLKRLVLK